jgi:hypothetical protein
MAIIEKSMRDAYCNIHSGYGFEMQMQGFKEKQ